MRHILETAPERLGSIQRFVKRAVRVGDAMAAMVACRDLYQPCRPARDDADSTCSSASSATKPYDKPLATHVTKARNLGKTGNKARFTKDTNKDGLSATELAAGHKATTCMTMRELSPFKGKGRNAPAHNMAISMHNNILVRSAARGHVLITPYSLSLTRRNSYHR